MHERVILLADELVRSGIEAVFGVPGSGLSLQLITALEERGVPFHGACHEAAAAMMAGAYGRERNSIGCSISIKGPGLACMFPGILSNHYEQMPALSISEAYGSGTPHRMHKRLDHFRILEPCTKARATWSDPRTMIPRLIETARAEIPGPVHLDIFADDEPELLVRSPGDESSPPSESSVALRKYIADARRPVVIAGRLALRRGWTGMLRALTIPVFTTVHAKGILDETSPHAAGIFTGDGKSITPERQVIDQADLIVGLGLRNTDVLSPHSFPARFINLDEVGSAHSAGFQPVLHLRKPAADFIAECFETLQRKSWGEDIVANSLRDVRQSLARHDWLPGPVFARLQHLLPAETRLVVDTGSFCTAAEHIWNARSPSSFLASANGRFMGTSLPMALGAALANSSIPTICAAGDGGFRCYFADIKLAIEHKLKILLILMSDGRLGSIADAPAARGLSTRATRIGNPSWHRAVEAIGCPAARIASMSDLEAAVAAWKTGAGPYFVEAAFDPEAYARLATDVR